MQGGWRALVFTFAWLRQRRMHAWAWAYLPFSTPFVLALWLLAFAGDACARALAGWGPAAHAVFATLLAVGWIAPPLVLSRLKSPEPAGRLWPPLVSQFLILAIAFVLAPQYADYRYRSYVNEALGQVAPLRAEVAEALAAGKPPAQPKFAPTQRVKAVEVSREGAIRATLATGMLAGRTVSFERAPGGDWRCRSADLPAACVPASCRQ